MDPTQQYLNQIGRYPLLTPEEEIQYSRQIQAMMALQASHKDGSSLTKQQRGIMRRGKRAKDQMIIRNLRLVVNIAKKYARRCNTLELLDLVQSGNIGLNRATELFDATRGYKFSTYAYWWIRQAISRTVQTQDSVISLPVYRQDELNRVILYMSQELARTGKKPSLAECADILDVDLGSLENSVLMAQSVASLDAKPSGECDKGTLIDLIPDESTLWDDSLYAIEHDIFDTALSSLDDDERILICQYNGLAGYEKMTLIALGKVLGISREAVRQKHKLAMNKLRQRIACQRHG